MPSAPPAPTGPVVQPHGPAWLRSPVGLGKAVAVLLGVVIAVDLFAVYADFTLYDVMSSMTDDGLDYSGYNDLQGDAERADTLFAAAGVAQLVAFVAAIVVYLVWFLRVRVNAEVFNPFGHSKKRAWAGWGWFVPVVNLWYPRRIMLDIWDASSPVGTRASHSARQRLVDAVAGRDVHQEARIQRVQPRRDTGGDPGRRRPGARLRRRRHRGRRARDPRRAPADPYAAREGAAGPAPVGV